MILLHPSSLYNIMGDAKSIDPDLLIGDLLDVSKKKTKTAEDKAILEPLWDRTLSAGAKTYLTELAKEIVYGYKSEMSSKYTEKGLQVEQQSIDLYNDVNFTSHVKNTERRENQWLSGECDIFDEDSTKDIKSSWSLETFPVTSEMAHDLTYEWQGRGYMNLWNTKFHEVAFCMVSTPEILVRYENPSIHFVDHIDPALRITKVVYQRDMALEAKMIVRCEVAQKFVEDMVLRIKREHS